MHTFAKYHQAEEAHYHAILIEDLDAIQYTAGKMDALLDMLQFYERLDNYNIGYSE